MYHTQKKLKLNICNLLAQYFVIFSRLEDSIFTPLQQNILGVFCQIWKCPNVYSCHENNSVKTCNLYKTQTL